MQSNEYLRMLLNLVRKGRVIDIDHENAMVRVETGELTTNWLRWMAPAAGATSEWAPPSMAEQVLILSPGGDLADGVVLRGIHADDTPPPSKEAAVHCRKYPDGTLIAYDYEQHVLAVTFPGAGSILIDGPEAVTIQTKTATVEADTFIVKAKEATFSGNLTADGTIKGAEVKAGDISLLKHVHLEKGDGKLVGTPQ